MRGTESLSEMILIVNVCKEKLHYYEFVKPIENILVGANIKFQTIGYRQITTNILNEVDSVIICGTSLKDFEYEKNLKYFKWIKEFDKPLLGICAGMQIIGLVYGGKMKNKTEIGFFTEEFKESFFGLGGSQEVYHLHNSFVDFKKIKEFEVVCSSKEIIQAVKLKNKETYGILFHPEVRQKELVLNFLKKSSAV